MDQNMKKINECSWIIALEDCKHIATGHTPNFGQVNRTSSYRTEVYVSLASILFIQHYANYYKIQLNNNFTALCDNEAYVNKLQQLIKNPYQFRNPYKNNEPEVIKIILQYLPDNFTIQHIFGHQDDKTQRKDLSIYVKLNIDADHLATNFAAIPINTHVISMFFAVYVKTKYIHNKVDHHISQQFHVEEARDFLMKNYK